MRSRIMLVGLLAVLSSCASPANDRVVRVPVRPAAGVDPDLRDADACTKAGGWWTTVGREATEACVIRAKDSGKACTDDADCEAFCAAPNGASAGSTATGTCTSGETGSCDAMHVRQHRAVVSCVE